MGANLPKFFHKNPEGIGVKDFCLPAIYKFAIPQTDRTKIADAFASRMAQDHWVLAFWWYPHPTP